MQCLDRKKWRERKGRKWRNDISFVSKSEGNWRGGEGNGGEGLGGEKSSKSTLESFGRAKHHFPSFTS